MADEILNTNELIQLFTNVTASAPHQSDQVGAGQNGNRIVSWGILFGAIEFDWTGLDASDGVLTVEMSTTGNEPYVPKSGATYTFPAGDGTNLISLNGVMTEKYYRVTWDPGANTTGTLNCWIYGKTHGV